MGWLFGRRDQMLSAQEQLDRAHAEMGDEPSASAGFRMVVQDVFAISGRGTVVTGTIRAGTVRVRTRVTVERDGARIAKAEVGSIEQFRRAGIEQAGAGENVGLLLSGITRDQVRPGDVLAG